VNIIAIIPARYKSTRFEGKPLVDIGGKSMLQRVWEQCKKAKHLSHVIIATDDERIFNHAKNFGAEVMMTSEHHQSGTERCAEVISKLNAKPDAIINVQGDEPFIDENYIDKIAELLQKKYAIATLAHPILDKEETTNPNKVKVVLSKQGKALYFSRSAIPFERNSGITQHFGHVGIYGYQTLVLENIVQLPESVLEKMESLEQLRWLENDLDIYVSIVEKPTQGIDTPQDLEKVLKSGNF
jgi:3-deoxy-manno-octulosonate cytidylyltransferase (CMP-KDO synthetase)